MSARPSTPALVWLGLVAAMVWHALAVGQHWKDAQRVHGANDFASYYYAVDVAVAGGDPYDRAAVSGAARDAETRKGVHPFFYPPPFLLGMTWVRAFDLHTAYRVWFLIDELLALACAWTIWRWWAPRSRTVGPVVMGTLALLTAIPNNHVMGQANLPVLLLVLLALALEDRGRQGLAGALMGAACMAKMSPALFVAWWLLRGRWTAVAAACGTAVGLTVLSLGLVAPAVQWRFYTEVLPTFGTGSYNGLGVGIDLFGNHSLPNLYDDWFPAGGGAHLVLSSTARWMSTGTLVAGALVTGWWLRREPTDALGKAAQAAAIAALMLLVPVITYEHHLVWLMPAAVVAVVAVDEGRLPVWWAVAVGAALTVWCFDLVPLKGMWTSLKGSWPVSAWVVRELKLGAIVVLYASAVTVGRRST